MVKRVVFTVALLAVASSFSGCPRFNIVLGNWELQWLTFTPGVTFGLTLNADRTITPYLTSPTGGLLIGNWEWTSNGSRVSFFSNDPGNQMSFSGQLLSDTSAAGDVMVQGEPDVFGDWEAVYAP